MRAALMTRYGPPELLTVEEVPEPRPGAGEVAVNVAVAALNFPDLLIMSGGYQAAWPLPLIPGSEFAGTVAATGPGVTDLAPGDRVSGTVAVGAFAERVVAPAAALWRVPDGADLADAAAFRVTYLSTYHALRSVADVREGEWVVVLGAAGGVGLAAVDIARLLGARVIAAAAGQDKLAVCRARGADEVVDYASEDLKSAIKRITAGGADVVIDPVGGPYSEQALRATAWSGRFVCLGFASGQIPRIPLNLVLLKGCQIVGVFWGAFAFKEPEKNRANGARIFAAVAEGKLRPRVDAALPFTRATEALERLERRDVRGKLVLVP
jgi:NADPH2:quinone reductase